MQIDGIWLDFAGNEGSRVFEVRTEPAAEYLIGDDELPAAQLDGRGVVGIDVDELDDPVRIAPRRAREEMGGYVAANRHIVIQQFRLP